MSKQKTAQPRYMVSVCDEPAPPGVLRFTFVPKGLQQAKSVLNKLRFLPNFVAPFSPPLAKGGLGAIPLK